VPPTAITGSFENGPNYRENYMLNELNGYKNNNYCDYLLFSMILRPNTFSSLTMFVIS